MLEKIKMNVNVMVSLSSKKGIAAKLKGWLR